MGEDLYRLTSTGLLGVIVLLLLLAVSQLGRLRRALDTRDPAAGPQDRAEESTGVQESATSETTSQDTPEQDIPGLATSLLTDSPTEQAPDEEGPYERDGRWWFRRDGELLVYDERTEQWVNPDAGPQSRAETGAEAQPIAELEPHPLDEARDWTATQEPAVASAPGPEPITAPVPITEGVELQTEEGEPQSSGAGGSAGHWKCPSCGVINGSTATSCRMCFSARP